MTIMLKELEKLATATNQNLLDAFSSLMDYSIGFFSVGEQRKAKGWKFSKEQNTVFYETFQALIMEYKEGIEKHEWCDPLGNLFMEFSKGFASLKGQFFTPPAMCDMMASITLNGDEPEGYLTKFGRRVVLNDSSAGSSRNLLAGYIRAMEQLKWKRKPYLVAEDLDALCCKMSALNMCVHGCYGEVVNHNTLTEPRQVRFGYIINETMYPIPVQIPSIRYSENPRDFYICGYGM